VAKLSRKQLLAKNCLDLSLNYWFRRKDLHVYWITLTSSPASVDAKKDIWASFHKLRIQAKRDFEISEIETCTVETNEGFGVLHLFWVCDGDGMPNCQKWLSEKWQTYHLAHRVWVNTLNKKNAIDAAKLAQYTITQYTVDQGSSFKNVRWSRFSFLPMRPADLIKKCYTYLKQELFPFEPWHLKSRLILGLPNPHYYAFVKMARALALGHTFKIKSRELFLSMGVDIMEL
jgi:hypothetical protein